MFDRAGAIDRIHGRYDTAEHEATRNIRIGHQRLQDRRRIGKSTRFDDDAFERHAAAIIAPLQQVLKGLRQVGADFAAEAPGL